MTPNLNGLLENTVKPSKFNNVSSLILHFKNEEVDQLSIFYIQLKGVLTNIKMKIVRAVYEAKPMLADHKVN